MAGGRKYDFQSELETKGKWHLTASEADKIQVFKREKQLQGRLKLQWLSMGEGGELSLLNKSAVSGIKFKCEGQFQQLCSHPASCYKSCKWSHLTVLVMSFFFNCFSVDLVKCGRSTEKWIQLNKTHRSILCFGVQADTKILKKDSFTTPKPNQQFHWHTHHQMWAPHNH